MKEIHRTYKTLIDLPPFFTKGEVVNDVRETSTEEVVEWGKKVPKKKINWYYETEKGVKFLGSHIRQLKGNKPLNEIFKHINE